MRSPVSLRVCRPASTTTGTQPGTSNSGQFAANQALQNSTSAVLNKALGQDGSLGDALTTTLANTFAAAGANETNTTT